MNYNKFVLRTTVWSSEAGAIVERLVIIQLTKGSTEAMRMVIEDWDEQRDGELRSIELLHITGIERPEEE